MEVACQVGVCYHSTDFLQDKTRQLKEGVANNFKGNTEVHPSKTHKAPTPINECKKIKLGGLVIATQGMTVVTGDKHDKGKIGTE